MKKQVMVCCLMLKATDLSLKVKMTIIIVTCKEYDRV